MGETIHHFKTIEDYKEYMENDYQEPFVSCINYDKTTIRYNKTEEEKERDRLLRTPLTFEIQSDGNIRWVEDSSYNAIRTIEYSKDNGETWTSITNATGDTAPSISVESGDTVQFRGNNSNYVYSSFSGSTAQFSVKGNVMSLIDSTDFVKLKTLSGSYNFQGLFYHCTGLTDASELILPATTLAMGCYWNMFSYCTSLRNVPELPATILTESCYQSMFWGCTNLTTAPELSATTLASNCYDGMFGGCTSLTGAPELPAETLANSCYYQMFYGCNSLTTTPELPATTLAGSCYQYMFDGCTSLVNAPALTATTLAGNCYSYMFRNCRNLTTAPELPASALTESCYASMFAGCTNLINAPALPATTLVSGCYSSMFRGCTSLTTAPVLPAPTLASQCYQYMFNGCSSLTTAPELPATTLAYYCYYSMFNNCTSLTQAPALPATILAEGCYSSMFYGCTSLTTAPVLPATTLVRECYRNMFYYCNSLNYIKCLATDMSATNCKFSWVGYVASTGTFVKTAGVNWTTGDSGIPSGWTVEDDYLAAPLTFEVQSDGNIIWKKGGRDNHNFYKTIEYKLNNNSWTSITSSTGGTSISVVSGDIIQFRGNNKSYGYDDLREYNGYNSFGGSTAQFSVKGNIMSLINSTDFANLTTLESGYTFYYMFYNCTGLTDASKLILPATTLAMGCYWSMFQSCTSLVNAPELPATTLARSCYSSMFRNCSSLNYIKCLATDISATSCTNNWVTGVVSSGTFVKDPSMTGWTTGANGIPTSWTVQDAS